MNNGNRFITYIIDGKPGFGIICLNGAAARSGAPGDFIIIVSYVNILPKRIPAHRPIVVLVDENNKVKTVN